MYVCLYVCVYACMLCMYVYMYLCTMCVCMYVCMYVCIYVCMYVYMHVQAFHTVSEALNLACNAILAGYGSSVLVSNVNNPLPKSAVRSWLSI